MTANDGFDVLICSPRVIVLSCRHVVLSLCQLQETAGQTSSASGPVRTPLVAQPGSTRFAAIFLQNSHSLRKHSGQKCSKVGWGNSTWEGLDVCQILLHPVHVPGPCISLH